MRSVPSIQTFFKRSEEHHQEEDDTVEQEVTLQANAEVEEDEPVASCSHSTGDSQPDIPSTSSSHTGGGSSDEWMYQVSDPALFREINENARAVLIDRERAEERQS